MNKQCLLIIILSLCMIEAYASQFGVTVRAWSATEDNPEAMLEDPATAALSLVSEGSDVPVYGFTIRWTPDWLNDHDILTSFMTLEDSAPTNFIFASNYYTGSADIERDDLEILVRSRTNEHYMYYYGLRYIEADYAYVFSSNALPTYQTVILIEAGLGMSNSISKNGKHALFANFIYGLGEREVEVKVVGGGKWDDTITTHDLNFGYQYTVNNKISINTRFRSFKGYDSGELLISTSGLDFGITYNF